MDSCRIPQVSPQVNRQGRLIESSWLLLQETVFFHGFRDESKNALIRCTNPPMARSRTRVISRNSLSIISGWRIKSVNVDVYLRPGDCILANFESIGDSGMDILGTLVRGGAAAGLCLGVSLLSACAGIAASADNPDRQSADAAPHGLIIHGGAGAGSRATISAELEADMRSSMAAALTAGYQVLDEGGTSLDAVTAAILILEDATAFNAGKGAVFNAVGSHELDSSIMDGATLNAGAAAGVSTVRNPILLARAVMEHSPHVMLSGAGAEEFAREQQLATVTPDYFDTERRRRQLEQRLARDKRAAVEPVEGDNTSDAYFGTVGVVALDQAGNLAAGTSTGGMTAKRYGRIGDSPVIGAGTYANNASCGVSSTGHGEYFIRHVVAYSICARMEHGGVSLEQAADDVVMTELVEAGGSGGVIAMDARGNIAWPFNSSSMVRAHQSRDQAPRVLIFRKE